MKLLFFLLLLWVLVKAVGMIFRNALGGSMDNRTHRFDNRQSGKRNTKGGVNIDHDPEQKGKGYQGGEYVDYEEVD